MLDSAGPSNAEQLETDEFSDVNDHVTGWSSCQNLTNLILDVYSPAVPSPHPKKNLKFCLAGTPVCKTLAFDILVRS